ncbi:hypothetical protein BSL78_06492 [Apostichopus japonicus]|uniref:NACHT domain-containing protein n=1 Tax=Stichopus japonicus TaxID=307972 RepID=A0A2G8L8Q9_STIJA|nr:hypothetical protein BSL78_06492 [Apostichopus japonicus]
MYLIFLDSDVDTLMKHLKQSYISFKRTWCSDSTYKITFNIKNGKRCKTVTKDNELIDALFLNGNDKRVLFCGERGIGKSQLFRHIAKRWMKGEILKDFMLVYLQLPYVPKGANILEETLKLLKHEICQQACQELSSHFKEKKSIVMLDGINDWSRLTTDSNIDNRNTDTLTVENLLKGNPEHFKNMRIWISSVNIEENQELVQGLYTKVELTGFTNKQREEFIRQEMSGKSWKITSYVEKLLWKADTPSIEDALERREENFPTRSPLITRFITSSYLTLNGRDRDQLAKHLLNFITHMSDTIKFFIESKNFDILACLLKVGTKTVDEYKKYAQMLQMKELVFRQSGSDYYEEAILHLLKTLDETGRKPYSVEVYNANPIRLLSYLPKVEKQVVFYNAQFSEDPDCMQIANTNKIKFRKI